MSFIKKKKRKRKRNQRSQTKPKKLYVPAKLGLGSARAPIEI